MDPIEMGSMKLPDNCRFELLPFHRFVDVETYRARCCRAAADFYLGKDEPPLCRFREVESEVYRFHWRSRFNGAAFVGIAHRSGSVELRAQVLGRSILSREEPVVAATLPAEQWDDLQRALTISDFWSLDATDDRRGLDGAQWFFEGRRGDTYHWVNRWCPRGAVYDLGRLFFTLAGPALADIKLY